jgi:hypothetical protein
MLGVEKNMQKNISGPKALKLQRIRETDIG